ncbi:Ars binding protein 1, partial [Globisporangium splendens]
MAEGRRQNLTIQQRFEICQHSKANPKLTQQQLAQWAKETFGMLYEPSQTSISYALTRGKHFKTLEEAQRKLRKRRSVKYPKLDELLFKWVLDCDQRDIRISGELVKQKAHAFCDKLKIAKEKRPHFSNGWLASFNKRHNLKKFKRDRDYQGSDSETDDYEVSAWKKGRKGSKKLRFPKQEQQGGDKRNGEGESSKSGVSQPWNELTEEELEARKRESDLRIEGLRYDNTLKRLRVAEENMLARKRLKDAGVPQDEIDRMIPAVSAEADNDQQTVI